MTEHPGQEPARAVTNLSDEGVIIACFSCRSGTRQAPEQRPEGGYVYDSGVGWRCPRCAETVIEELRAYLADVEREGRAAQRRCEIYAAALFEITEPSGYRPSVEAAQRVADRALKRAGIPPADIAVTHMQGVYEAYARRVGWSDLRRRFQERLTMAREVLDAEGLAHVAALVPIEEVLIWMDEIEEQVRIASNTRDEPHASQGVEPQ